MKNTNIKHLYLFRGLIFLRPLIDSLKLHCSVFRVIFGEVKDKQPELFEPEGRVFRLPGASLRITERRTVRGRKELINGLHRLNPMNECKITICLTQSFFFSYRLSQSLLHTDGKHTAHGFERR